MNLNHVKCFAIQRWEFEASKCIKFVKQKFTSDLNSKSDKQKKKKKKERKFPCWQSEIENWEIASSQKYFSFILSFSPHDQINSVFNWNSSMPLTD